MQRGVMVVAAAVALGAAGAAWAAGKPFQAQMNETGYPIDPKDKRVPVTATGPLQPWRGRAWWQVLAFCAGTWENQAYEANEKGDKARSDALNEEVDKRFYRPALVRLMDDRGISADDAAEIMRPDSNFQMLVAADEERPFAEDQKRCDAYEAAHVEMAIAAMPRPAPAPAPAVAKPAEPAAFERRFKAKAYLTHTYDGQPYWQLMTRCAKGSQGVAGSRGEMMAVFGRTARDLLVHDARMSQADAEAKVTAAFSSAEAIAPGASPAEDACVAIGQQLQEEVKAGG